MLGSFFHRLSGYSFEAKVFFAIIALALLARGFTLFTMPDAPLTDTLFHLSITRYIVQKHMIPFSGIPFLGVQGVPVPLYYFLTAVPFAVLRIPFSLQAARIFPFIFSFLQLLLAFLLLKRLFPNRWHFGFAFVAMQPLLVIFGAVNYVETLASVTVLLCFFVYWRFVESNRLHLLILMPFALAAMALSKESATILVPVFFLAFLYEIWAKKQGRVSKEWVARAFYFAVVSVLLCSAWFLASFFETGVLNPSITAGSWVAESFSMSPGSVVLFPLNFNAAFWFFLSQGFGSSPFGISPELAFAAVSIVSFPILCLIFYGLAKGLYNREKHAALLLLCLAFAFVPLIQRSSFAIQVRMLVPVMPLLGIAVCEFFKGFRASGIKKVFVALFALTAIYSIAFSCLYAMHFNEDYNNHLPLYNFAKGLPEGSAIAIHPNKTRQIAFISEKQAISYPKFQGMDAEQLRVALKEQNATHLAVTCYKNPWDLNALAWLEQQGFLEKVFEDKCSTLYKLEGG